MIQFDGIWEIRNANMLVPRNVSHFISSFGFPRWNAEPSETAGNKN